MSKLVGLLYLAVAMVTVGSTIVASKIIAGGLPPFTATALRFAIASPIFLVLFSLSKHSIPKLTRREWGLLLVQAGLGSVAYTVLLILGMSFLLAGDAGVIVGTLPVVMGILAITMFGDAVTLRFVIALCVAFAGVLLVTFGYTIDGLSLPQTSELIGLGPILAAVVCEALFLLLNKQLRTPLPALVQAGLMSGFGLALAILPACYEWATGMLSDTKPAALMSVAYYALVPTVIGFILWYEGASRTRASEAALMTAVMPVSALVLAALVLGEAVTMQQGIGCIMVVFAIALGIDKSE